jgi:DegV family protein with EDD domain
LLAAADWVAAGRDELNRINVFPVPDGDTGTNMCLTLRAVARALRDITGGSAAPLSLPFVAETMAQASVRGARGNSGMMLSQFLLGFREGIRPGARWRGRARQGAPDAVFQLASGWGTLESTKADDMRAQHQALQTRRPIAFVSDTACDLPDEVVLQYDIKLVPTQIIVDDRPYRDRLELTSAEFFQRLRAGLDATTSQPTPQAFTDAYRDAARAGEHVIAVVLSSGLSGTFGNADAAARRFDQGKVTVVDSRSASLGEGLLVVRGVELAAAGWSAVRIVKELQRIRAQSGGYFTVDSFERLVRSGRVGRGRAWLGTKLNLKPLMAPTIEGKIEPIGKVRGKEAARRRILELLDRALTPRPGALRLGIVHGDIPEFAEALRAELVARYRPMQALVAPITPVIAAHAGIGAWGVFYQNEENKSRKSGV